MKARQHETWRNLLLRVQSSLVPSDFQHRVRISEMSILHRQTLQHPTFHVLWSSKTSEGSRPPLQIRSFTSDSYRALKEREGKKDRRQRGKNKRCHRLQIPRNRSECFPGEATGVSRASFQCNDSTVVLDSNTLLSPMQDDLKAQAEGRTLSLLGGPRRPEAQMQAIDGSSCSSAVESCTSPSPHPGLTHQGNSEASRWSCDTIAGSNNEQNPPSAPTLVRTLCHEPGVMNKGLGDGSDDGKYAADSASSASSHTGGCASDSDLLSSGCPISRDRPLRVGIRNEQSAKPPRTAVMAESVDSMNAEHFRIDTRQHEETAEERPCDIDLSCKAQVFESTAQTAWTKDLDKHLLHLRDVAQLTWHTLVAYFPGTAPIDVRRRYQQLTKKAAADQAMDDPHLSQRDVRSLTHLLSDARGGNAQTPVAKTRPLHSALPTKKQATAPRHPARRRRTNAQAVECEPAPSSTLAYRDTQQRTSRCGRRILHPFRHRRSEGYL